jgi:cytochrome c-type biogenesis protein
MYSFLNQISVFLSQPFATVAHSTNIALISALFLGFVASVAPCQISANLGAMSYFGHRGSILKKAWAELLFYLLGKMAVFTSFGFLFWWFGDQITTGSIPLFIYARKLLGPLLVIIGLFFIGWIRLPGSVGARLSGALEAFSKRVGGNKGAFLLGAAFSLGFCPTMSWIFFGLLMPIVMESGTASGLTLTPIFAIGTAMPLLFFFSLYIGVGMDRFMMKKAKAWGKRIQVATGIFFVLLGISDTITYWTI